MATKNDSKNFGERVRDSESERNTDLMNVHNRKDVHTREERKRSSWTI